MPEDRGERRPVEPTVVVRPPPYRRIHEPRDLLQRLVVPGGGQPPVTDRLPDHLGGLVADRREEAHEELPPPILGPPGPKGVAEEVELDVLMLAPPVIVLAIHDLGLLGVKLKTAFLQTLPDRFEHVLRLSPALGVDDHIVSIALEPDVRIGPGHPEVECVMPVLSRSKCSENQ